MSWKLKMIPINIFLCKRLHHKGYSFHNIGNYSGVNFDLFDKDFVSCNYSFMKDYYEIFFSNNYWSFNVGLVNGCCCFDD